MANNPGLFNKEASATYKTLSRQKKEELQLRSTESTSQPRGLWNQHHSQGATKY